MAEISYEAAAKELEEILEQLKSGEITVDELSQKVERAAKLLKLCSEKLRKTEEQVQQVIKDLNL